MKKAYIQFNENSTSAFLSRFDGNEQFSLYADIDSVDGGWLLETSGSITCLNELEAAGSEAMINAISEIVDDPTTPWEEISEEDAENIRDTLAAWGIA